MNICEFHVRKDDLTQASFVTRQSATMEGDVLVRIALFGLSANNISYSSSSGPIDYWSFFLAPEGWGNIPVWGIGEVVESRHEAVPAGERLFGYFPMATHLKIRAGNIGAHRITDVGEHRRHLSPVYNNYIRLCANTEYDQALDRERILLLPLYATSFAAFDWLDDNGFLDVEQIVVVSASSKTAIGLAYALSDGHCAAKLIGLTSPANSTLVGGLGLYHQVVGYDALDQVDRSRTTLVVDFSANYPLLADLHKRLDVNMKFNLSIGLTHRAALKSATGFIEERSQYFFAPAHIKKRANQWGRGEFEKRSLEFWKSAASRSRAWLTIEHVNGPVALEGAFREVHGNLIRPDRGIVASL